MRVGVTGGTGFVGQYILRDFAKDFEFVVPFRKRTGQITKKNVKFIESDYTVESLSDIFSECDAVVHLAGIGMPKNQNSLSLTDYISNVVITANVFEACKNDGIRRIIYTSSKAVWGRGGKNELSESYPARPENEYGVSKLCCETLASFYNDVYKMQIKCYRIGEICGIDLRKGMLNPFWKVLLSCSVEKRPIPIYGRGIAKRDLIYVKDVVDALMLGIQKEGGGVFNIGYGKIYSNREIAKMFCHVFENFAGLKMQPEEKEWGTEQNMLIDKASKILGFKAKYDLEKIVRDIRCEYESMLK